MVLINRKTKIFGLFHLTKGVPLMMHLIHRNEYEDYIVHMYDMMEQVYCDVCFQGINDEIKLMSLAMVLNA